MRAYKRSGGRFESVLILQDLYEAGMTNDKFIPVAFDSADTQHILKWIKQVNYYNVATHDGYDSLLAQRAVSNSDSTSQASMNVRAAADRLTSELLSMHRVGTVDAMTYVRAKRFLSSLAYETNVTLYQPDAELHMLTTYK